MTRSVPVQTTFSSGEMSPRLFGREDVQRYLSGCATLQNFRLAPQGGAYRRSGTRYVAAGKDAATRARLVGFEYSVDVAYVLEFANLFMRVFRDGGQIESSPGVPYEIATPYATAVLRELQSAQSADVMYLAHASHWPRKLTRTADTAWTLAQVAFVDGPYLPTNTTATTMTPSATTGNITITASAAYFNANMAPVGTEPGAYIRIQHGATWGYAQITGFTSTTVVNATVKSAFGATTGSAAWAEGAWSTYRGFPRAITFFEQRLYFGGTSYQPQTLWGSAIGAYEDHTPGVADDDAVNYTIASQKLNAIQWLVGQNLLFIGTSGAEYAAGDPSLPLTPTNVRITPQTTHGSAYLQPVVASSAVLFLTRGQRKVRELVFNFQDDAYRAPDVTVLAEHITRSGIVGMAYAAEPDPMVFAVRSDGVLLSCAYDREQELVGWAREVTDGVVESVAVIPATSGDEGSSQIWISVKRTIDGADVRYIEYFTPKFENDEIEIEDACFVDSSLTYAGAATTTLTGLGHLEGETVQVLGNGAELPPVVVSGGEVTLQESVTQAVVGLGYTSTLKTLPGITGARNGSTQGRAKSWGKMKARLYETVGLTINGRELPIRSTSDLMDTAIQPFTGIREAQLVGWSDEGQVTFEQARPLPATILAVFGVLQVEDH